MITYYNFGLNKEVLAKLDMMTLLILVNHIAIDSIVIFHKNLELAILYKCLWNSVRLSGLWQVSPFTNMV